MSNNPDELAIQPEGGIPSLENISPRTDDEASAAIRNEAPDRAGEACPVCGDPYDVGESGFLQSSADFYTHTLDVKSHVKHCIAPFLPNWVDDTYAAEVIGIARPFKFVHKDEHISEVDDGE